MKEQRAFLARAVRYLAGPAGIRQFLDIGTGLPSANNTHEVAQAVAPDCRVVYVDNDPLVLTYARVDTSKMQASLGDCNRHAGGVGAAFPSEPAGWSRPGGPGQA